MNYPDTKNGAKSTVEQIRSRFDKDVERFSNLETGQTATIDAPLVLELIARCSAKARPDAKCLLDIGCGAGNYSLKLLQYIPNMNVTLLDLSAPMLDRARQRVSDATTGRVQTIQNDMRDVNFGREKFDVVVAAATLHHLRGENEWEYVFRNIYNALTPGGCFWIADLIDHDAKSVSDVMWERYGEYIRDNFGEEKLKALLSYIQEEDTPRSVVFQLDMLRRVGFKTVEILHKNAVSAAFGAIKA